MTHFPFTSSCCIATLPCVGTAIIVAVAMLASFFSGAWMTQRVASGRSVMPAYPHKASVENDDGQEQPQREPVRGRPVL